MRADIFWPDRLSRQGGISREFRFDVVAVSGFRIWHLDNAWFSPT